MNFFSVIGFFCLLTLDRLKPYYEILKTAGEVAFLDPDRTKHFKHGTSTPQLHKSFQHRYVLSINVKNSIFFVK
jgi:hypothetical protein